MIDALDPGGSVRAMFMKRAASLFGDAALRVECEVPLSLVELLRRLFGRHSGQG